MSTSTAMMRCIGRQATFPVAPCSALEPARPGRRCGMAPTSTSVLPPTRTARAWALRRWPWQVGQRDDAHVLFQLHAARAGRGLLEAAQQLRHDAFPFAAVLPDAAAALLPVVGDVPVAAAVQQPLPMLARQILPRRLQIDAERLAPRLRRCACASGPCRAAGPTIGMAPS